MDTAMLSAREYGNHRPAIFGAPWQAALNVAILAADVCFFSGILDPGSTGTQWLVVLGFTILGYGALRMRNSYPVLAYGLAWAYATGAAVVAAFGFFQFSPFFVLAVTLFTVASERRPRVSSLALATSMVPIALDIWYDVQHEGGGGYGLSVFVGATVFYLVISAEAWAMGNQARLARRAVEHHQRRVALANLAATGERLRIAHEIHDILAHTITIMVLQAGGARRVLATDPATADDALSRVEEVGKTAMNELRRVLTLIRSPAEGGNEPGQSGLADIGALLGNLRQAGITARLEVQGSPALVAESVSRTVYRIVQEAVTNIVKHAGPGTMATVRLTWGSDLGIEIVNDGGGVPTVEAGTLSNGQGLIGLAERVAVFGGTITAGRHQDGFRVLATLPLPAPGSPASGPYPAAGN